MSKRTALTLIAVAALGLATMASVAWAQNTPAPAAPAAPATPATPEFQPAPPAGTGNAPAPAAAGNATGNAATGNGGTGAKPGDQAKNPMDWSFFAIILGGFVLLYLWSSRSRKKQEAKRREMLSSLKKGDKVTSIGGIMGTVIEVRDDEVTVKVDETNNVRMKFARWAIRGVGEEAKAEPEQKK